MTRLIVLVTLLLPLSALAQTPPDTTAVAPVDTTVVPPDSTVSAPPAVTAPVVPGGPFAAASKRDYVLRHSYSFDHWLEFDPARVVARRGPLGGDVRFSRFGIGRGRGVVIHEGIVLNDPQNDIAPAVHVPASAVGTVSGRGARSAAIEGVVSIDDLPPPLERPRTFLELSKGTNNLRQRRVYFSSVEAPIGIDVSYDELLNDGYAFDATQSVGLNVPGFGSSTSRQYGVRLRGRHGDDQRYSISLREFTSSFNGDLQSSSNEARRSGHLAAARATFGPVGIRVFERGYSVAYPDSHTVNQTTAAYATWRLRRSGRLSLVADAGFEDIVATQTVGGARSNPALSRTTGSVTSTVKLGSGVFARAHVSATDLRDYTAQWGGGLELGARWERWRVGIDARRSYRMPNLGELFLPEHDLSGVTVSGNESLDAEYAWEGSGRIGVTVGAFTNEVRATGIRIEDAIAPRHRSDPGGPRVAPENTGGALLYAIEERLLVDASFRGFEVRGDVAAAFTEGDRVGFFASAPRTNLRASLRVGGQLFEATSALFAGAEYVRGGERTGLDGTPLDAYEVINFTLDGRLLDADMYLALFNAFDERYRTESNFLMMPRTFVYGISWTLWE